MPRRLPLVSFVSLLLAAGVLLVGCTTPDPAPTPTPSATPSESDSPTPTPEPTQTPSSTPVDIPCDELVSLQAMYDFNPNFSLLSSWTPDAGTPAREALDAHGVACRWQNDTSGDTIDVSVASFDEGGISAKQADAASGTSTSYGYFVAAGGVGTATAFDGSYWVVIRSAWFSAPGDAEQLVESVLAAL